MHIILANNHNQKSPNCIFYVAFFPSIFFQIIAALAVSLGPLAAGLGKGYSSPAIDNLQELQNVKRGNYTHFSVNDQQVSWIASLSLLGALFGGMFGGLAMQYGRKRVLTLMSLPFSISWLLTMFAKSVETMFFTAFVGGFCCAIVSTVAQVYVSEIASPDIRGFLSAIQKIAGHFGMLISYLLGAYLDWRQLAMLIAMAPIMLFISVIYIPETPSFLVLRGCDEEAHCSLQWLRGPHKNVELELDTIRSNVRTTRMNLLNRLSSSAPATANVKPILITCGLMIFQRFTGASSFNFYAVTIFRKTFAGMNPHGAAIAVGFVQLLASMLSGLLIDTVGRIPLLIVSSIFMSLALAGFGSCVYYGETSKMLNDWIPLLCVLVFTVAFALGISPISWLLVGELFPLEYRAVGSSIATSFSYFCAFLSVKTFVDFQSFLGLHGTFWLYACISCVGLFFVIMVVPETKGRDLEEMDPRYVRTLTINR
ncbi:AGAP009274-PA [Anopheles gambiae str. PEST]|uniref:AGAP009274-PA n=1 Tax=Anopheles gambiae TaxID=7165 RepID=Q7PVH7_ANOGA|nr:AGAP009274-PA [Anopheles gambiae str. PEST]